ncbi:putative quinol monooxygenase [Colwellia sp. Bg11-12]|jgi:quinol monooxygenase YgiN|uniref:putative quinol monooxygenase n=1 Tax=Colwellia sp. Bg11-12 TaxID=2759817 RepID=UPI0015F6DD7D|nr:antibiotic biosynthesis monooxygenase [Colwellia sp. Bg11-12]MBA6262835.1 antibiotic biosynthesis monooxygenase [Colwellia sp. Bg11-12]
MKSALLSIVLLLVTTYVQATPTNNKQVRESMKFGMQAVLIAAEGKGDELANFMLEASETVSKMDGCILYLVQQSLIDNSKVLVTELWDNKESHAASLTNEAVRAIIMKAKPIIIGMDHNPAKYIGGHGI